MHTGQHLARGHAEAAGGIVQARLDLREPGLDCLQCDRHEAHEVRIHEDDDRAAQPQLRRTAELAGKPAGKPTIQLRHGRHHADGDHDAGNRIPEAGHPTGRCRNRARAQPGRVSNDERERDAQHCGDAGQRKAVPGERGKAGGRAGLGLLQRKSQEQYERHDKPGQQRHRTADHCGERPHPLKAHRGRLAPRPRMERRTPAQRTLQHEDGADPGQQKCPELRRRDRIAEGKPGAEHTRGKRIHPEVSHRAVIGKRLHHRQCHACNDCGACKRQGHAKERPPRPHAQHPGRLEARTRLFQESGARKQVHIGIQDRGQDECRPAEGADFRQPVVPRPPAGPATQRRLQRPGELQEVRIGVGHHVRRHGNRENQRPREKRPPGEPAQAGEPRAADAENRNPCADCDRQQRGIQDIPGQDRRGEVRPGFCARHKQVQHHEQHRQRDQQGDRPGAEIEQGNLDPGQCGYPSGG